jgi:hypothetical protein
MYSAILDSNQLKNVYKHQVLEFNIHASAAGEFVLLFVLPATGSGIVTLLFLPVMIPS